MAELLYIRALFVGFLLNRYLRLCQVCLQPAALCFLLMCFEEEAHGKEVGVEDDDASFAPLPTHRS